MHPTQMRIPQIAWRPTSSPLPQMLLMLGHKGTKRKTTESCWRPPISLPSTHSLLPLRSQRAKQTRATGDSWPVLAFQVLFFLISSLQKMPPPPEFSIITKLLIAKHFIVCVAVIDCLYGKLKLYLRGKEGKNLKMLLVESISTGMWMNTS